MKAVTFFFVVTASVGIAHAEPKCFVDEGAVQGVSRDGRYALTSSTDGFGLAQLQLIDLDTDEIAIETTAGSSEFEDVGADELLHVGPLTLRSSAEWEGWRGTWTELRNRLEARCGHVELPTRAQEAAVEARQLSAVYVGTRLAALKFELPEADGCNSTTGEVIAGVACTKGSAVAPSVGLSVTAGRPAEVLAKISKDVYRRRHDPLGAYRLLNQLVASLKPETTSAELQLAIIADETLYLSHLGWLGHARCRALENELEAGIQGVWKAPPSALAARMKEAAVFNIRKCHPSSDVVR